MAEITLESVEPPEPPDEPPGLIREPTIQSDENALDERAFPDQAPDEETPGPEVNATEKPAPKKRGRPRKEPPTPKAAAPKAVSSQAAKRAPKTPATRMKIPRVIAEERDATVKNMANVKPDDLRTIKQSLAMDSELTSANLRSDAEIKRKQAQLKELIDAVKGPRCPRIVESRT